MEENQIRLSIKIPGDERGLKSFVAQFMANLNISSVVERVRGENGYFTTIDIEGAESKIQSGMKQLIDALKDQFPNITPPSEIDASEPKGAAREVHILSSSSPRPNSSGELRKTIPFEEIKPIDSASSLGTRTMSIFTHFGHIFGKLQKTIVTICYKNASMTHKKDFDISSFIDWTKFMEAVAAAPQLNIPVPPRAIYRILPDNSYSYVSQLTELQPGIEYYVQTELDKNIGHASFQNMDEFYDALRTIGCGQDDIQTIKKVFLKERIIVAILDSLTDEDLGNAGIVQIGLRKAIFAVLRKNGVIY